jgi:glycerol-3-phosphate cytidylyltransferase
LIGQTEWQNLLRQAKAQCDFLIAGLVADEVPIAQKGVTPVVPLAEPVEIVRNVRYVDLAPCHRYGDAILCEMSGSLSRCRLH